VRLITPGVLVIQAHDTKELSLLKAWPAAAVGAMVPGGAVRFTHDPSAGTTPWQRLTLSPAADARLARVGGLTGAQQSEELRQLEALAAPPPAVTVTAPAAAAASGPETDPIDRLAAWLLQQAQIAPSGAGN
jgi:hypothetical protein